MAHTGEQLELTPPRLPSIGLVDHVFAGVATAVDSAVLTAIQPLVEAFMIPSDEDLPALRASADPLLTEELLRNPRSFFAFLDSPVDTVSGTQRYRRHIRGGAIVGRGLASGYASHAPGVIDEEDLESGRRILVEHWTQRQHAPRATVVALHGFGMGRPRLDSTMLFASHWFERGLDVILLTLPYHGARTPPHARFSGEHFAVPDMTRLAASVHQAIFEIRRVVAWARQNSDAPVGLLGLSLGGYLAALMAGLDDDLDFVVSIIPPVCMGDLAWQYFSRSRRGAAESKLAFTRDELRAGFRVHSPLAHPLQLERRRVMIVAGRGDRVVPPDHPHSLWKHWGEPRIHWFNGSHVAPFGRQKTVEAITEHLEALEIL